MENQRLEWQENLSVGIPEIDAEHKTLIALINELHDAIRDRHESKVCHEILDRLSHYTNSHFREEERLMLAAGYADYQKHQQQHHDLVTQIAILKRRLDEGDPELSFELFSFLQAWLNHHIKETDKRFVADYRAHHPPQPLRRPWWKFW